MSWIRTGRRSTEQCADHPAVSARRTSGEGRKLRRVRLRSVYMLLLLRVLPVCIALRAR